MVIFEKPFFQLLCRFFVLKLGFRSFLEQIGDVEKISIMPKIEMLREYSNPKH